MFIKLRTNLIITVLLLTLFSLAACSRGGDVSPDVSPSDISDKKQITAEEVSLSDTSIQLGKGITSQLTAEGGKNISWSSSDTSIATVDNGLIRGENVGNCVVTAYNDSGSSAKCQVEVKKTCYLTFDDGPNDSTPLILEVLKENDVHATFFVVSSNSLEFTKQMHEQGCLVGIHTYSHKYEYCYRSYYSYYYGVELMARRVENYTGVRPNIIRFPGGTHNAVSDPLLMQRVANGAKDLGYRAFDWTATSGDTSQNSASAEFSIENIKKSCTEDVEIVLMHDKAFNAKALRTIIPYLREQGYVFETLDKYPEYSYTIPTRYSRKNKLIPSVSVGIGMTSAKIKIGEQITLAARMQPSNSTDYIRWESSDTSIAEVMPNGRVEGISQGNVEIYAITSSGKKAVSRVSVI